MFLTLTSLSVHCCLNKEILVKHSSKHLIWQRFFLSEEVIREINDVLNREKFDRYITWKERQLFLQLLIRETTLVQITEKIQECRDPKDNKLLELAVSGTVSHLITGDPDLLILDPFRGIRILTPKQFLDSFIDEHG